MSVTRAAWSLVGMLVITASVSAQTPPPLVRFAGVVPASAGAVPGGPATLTFAVYPDQQGGTPLWTETQTVTLDAEGRYAVVLGSTQPTGLPVDVFTSGEARWLGVSVAQGTEAPRVLLVSVPYALKAADATTVAGKPLSAFVLAGDTTGTGADGLTYVNTQALSTGLQAAGAPGQTGNVGTPNYLGVFTDATDLGNSVLYQSPTNAYLGVNTTSPLAPFHVVAGSAPAAFFDVYSPTLTALPVVYRAARGTPTAPSAVQTGDILGGLAVRGFGASVFSAGGRGQVAFLAAENWTDSAQGTALVFKTNPTGTAGAPLERMRVTPAGNVGIGTTTPGQLLSVAGTIESTTGGFKFPDGTMQTTAATTSSAFIGNSAFGISSLAANTTGTDNTAFGTAALQQNTGGNANTASGYTALTDNTTGSANTANGFQALHFNTTGSWNTATGGWALYANTTGSYNTASGYGALYLNTTGTYNTASGYTALTDNTTGSANTASGFQALYGNTTGSWNTATGAEALLSNTTGSANTASGYQALFANSTGTDNTASGYLALEGNTTGDDNTALGTVALADNTTGYSNTASGYTALLSNTTGYQNTASGAAALLKNTTGTYNTAVGYQAGYNLTTGSNNIDIGSNVTGFAGESNTIRIGSGQTQTFIAGIWGNGSDGNVTYVMVDGNGQLGTVNSSRRYKDDIADMAGASSGLMELRPVTFHYKSGQNPAGRTLQVRTHRRGGGGGLSGAGDAFEGRPDRVGDVPVPAADAAERIPEAAAHHRDAAARDRDAAARDRDAASPGRGLDSGRRGAPRPQAVTAGRRPPRRKGHGGAGGERGTPRPRRGWGRADSPADRAAGGGGDRRQ